MLRRNLFALAGAGAGALVAFLVGFGYRGVLIAALGCAAIVVAVAERKKLVQTEEELNRPISIFLDEEKRKP